VEPLFAVVDGVVGTFSSSRFEGGLKGRAGAVAALVLFELLLREAPPSASSSFLDGGRKGRLGADVEDDDNGDDVVVVVVVDVNVVVVVVITVAVESNVEVESITLSCCGCLKRLTVWHCFESC